MGVLFRATRILTILGFGLFVLAVVLARWHSLTTAEAVPVRHIDHAYVLGVNDFATIGPGSGCRLLDSETGRVHWMDLPQNDSLLFATASPWCDSTGHHQLVGRWLKRESRDASGYPKKFGLARYKFPGGQLIDQVELETVPSGSPCWIPGTEARVLFSGTDGRLYQYAFDQESDFSESRPDGAARARVFRWVCPPPGDGEVRVKDPIWPSDPRLKNCVIASVCYLERGSDASRFTPSELWWLQLDLARGTIEASGRLTAALSREPELDEHLPNVTTTAQGDLVLACLIREKRSMTCRLRLSRLEIDPATQTPRVVPSQILTLDDPVAAVLPIFSSDGSWVNVLRTTWGQVPKRAQRISVSGSLSLGGRPTHSGRPG